MGESICIVSGLQPNFDPLELQKKKITPVTHQQGDFRFPCR